MFLENSRYHGLETTTGTAAGGRTVTALKLRPLLPTPGAPHLVKDHDQLDVLAHLHHADGTKFWHIADANTALEASHLIADPGSTLLLPES